MNPSESILLREFNERTGISRGYQERLCRYLPGGDTRSVAHFEPYPVVLSEGDGALVRDIDGNEYLDVLNNYTSLVHGHGYPAILHAVNTALPGGTVFPAPHLSQLELAALLSERYSAERVRFTNSGSEAAMLALRIARSATGRRRLIMFEGGYHGCAPDFIDASPDTVRLPYNDPDAVKVDASVAAVFIEPFLGSGGVIPAQPDFLRCVQERAHASGALFVLDEVQGLRNAIHGTPAALGLDPDLVLMGKVIGGGFPVGAVGGRASLVDLTAAGRSGALVHSGTFNGNVITMAAGLACLQALDERAISVLNERATFLAAEIEARAAAARIPCSVTRAGSILQVHLCAETPRSSRDAATVPTSWVEYLHLALLLEGVYSAPRGMLNLSTVLSDDQLARVVSAYERAFARISGLVTEQDRIPAET